jgi:hypothetical protein
MAAVPPQIGPTLAGSVPLYQAAAAQAFSYNGITFDWTEFETPENFELAWQTLGGVEPIPSSSGVAAQRVAQTLGVVMETIKFEASFIGPNALTKAQALEALQKAQKSGPFQFGARTIQCTLFHLTEIYRTINDIRYAVELEPTVETTNGAAAAGTPATAALQQNLTDIAADPTPPALMELDAVPPAITAAQTTTVAGASLSTLQSLSTTFQSANAQLTTFMETTGTSIVPSDVSNYLSAASLAGSLSTAIATLGSFTGTTGTSVAVSGANAYTLAARYTGDVNNTDAIMSANGITDPFNIGMASIIIPSVLKAL